MIKKRTVFIVGAGASMPYGLPSGAELLRSAQSLEPAQLRKKICSSVSGSLVREFLNTVRLSQDESLDALLEHRKEIQKVGKLFIAASILEGEAKVGGKPTNGKDWFSYLFSRMAEGCSSWDEFASNNSVTFVTFNFDRLIECKLIDGLTVRYAKRQAGAAEILKHIPVIHVLRIARPASQSEQRVPVSWG